VSESLCDAAIPEIVRGYLGETPALSVNKCVLRKVPVDAWPSWHQDGAFLGADVRTINVWVALSDCGGDADAAGLELIPRRINHVVTTGTLGAMHMHAAAPAEVDKAAGDVAPQTPRFGPGDALLFDHLLMHRTATRPGLTRDRYALEAWLFAPSTFPADYAPLAL
jgi:hypothetical protein